MMPYDIHCVKSVPVRSYSRVIQSISPYAVQMLENAEQNNSEYGHFLCSDRELMRCHGIIGWSLLFKLKEQRNYVLCIIHMRSLFCSIRSGLHFLTFYLEN